MNAIDYCLFGESDAAGRFEIAKKTATEISIMGAKIAAKSALSYTFPSMPSYLNHICVSAGESACRTAYTYFNSSCQKERERSLDALMLKCMNQAVVCFYASILASFFADKCRSGNALVEPINVSKSTLLFQLSPLR